MIEQFIESIPARPYCGHSGAHNIRPKSAALKFPLIQFNHPRMRRWIAIDVDDPLAALAWEDSGLPPNLAMINPANGHGHLLYQLERPVYIDPKAPPPRPVRYFGAVHRGLTRALKGDPAYNGLLVKNPIHSDWTTHSMRSTPYTLAELAKHVDMSIRPGEIAADSVGRNDCVFRTVAKWSYRSKNDFDHFDSFASEVRAQCYEVNSTFSIPLGDREVERIAKSIFDWTWNNYTGQKKRAMSFGAGTPIRDRQRQAATRTAEIKRDRTARDIAAAISELGTNANKRAVARLTGLSLSTVKRHWKDC